MKRTATRAIASMRTDEHVCGQKMTRPFCTEKLFDAHAPELATCENSVGAPPAPGVYATEMRFESEKPCGGAGTAKSHATCALAMTPWATASNTVPYRFGWHIWKRRPFVALERSWYVMLGFTAVDHFEFTVPSFGWYASVGLGFAATPTIEWNVELRFCIVPALPPPVVLEPPPVPLAPPVPPSSPPDARPPSGSTVPTPH